MNYYYYYYFSSFNISSSSYVVSEKLELASKKQSGLHFKYFVVSLSLSLCLLYLFSLNEGNQAYANDYAIVLAELSKYRIT